MSDLDEHCKKALYEALEEMENDSAIVQHIQRELPNADDDTMQAILNRHVLNMGRLFALEGHSGFSANVTINMLERLLRFEPLGPLTGEDSEWIELDYGPDMAAQNKRCSHVFKRADGTAYDIDGRIFREPDGTCFTNGSSRVEVTFPYHPTHEYVDVPAPPEEDDF